MSTTRAPHEHPDRGAGAASSTPLGAAGEIPAAIARISSRRNQAIRLACELPDATLHVSGSSDHDIGHDRSDEIMSVIASCVR